MTPGNEAMQKAGAKTIAGDELADLTAFLASLSDFRFVTDPKFALPKTACGRKL